MKTVIAVIFFTLFANSALAFDLGAFVDSAGKDPVKSLNKNINGKVDEVVKKFEGRIDGYKKEMDGELKKYKDQLKEAEAMVSTMQKIKANAESYIRIAKIVFGVLTSGILALIFIMWRIWRNIVTMKKVVKNVASYEDIEKRLKAVEKAVEKAVSSK